MQPGRIFITIILIVSFLLGVFFIHQKERDKRFSGTTAVSQLPYAPPDVLKNYLPIVAMGYGLGTHASGAHKTGITIEARDGQKSLIPMSPNDDFLLNLFDAFLKHTGEHADFHVFATQILYKADMLKNTEYVLFNSDKTCQARFYHSTSESVCVTARDATAICMVLARIRLPLLFANKEFFTDEYWESLFSIQT